MSVHRPELKLLGVWQGSWDTNLVEKSQRAPIGMGIVTPAYRLIELLNSEPLAENRRLWLPDITAAKQD
jgi:hypothetical protein